MDVKIATMSLNLRANTVLTEGIDKKMNDLLTQANTRDALIAAGKWIITTIITALAAFAAMHAR